MAPKYLLCSTTVTPRNLTEQFTTTAQYAAFIDPVIVISSSLSKSMIFFRFLRTEPSYILVCMERRRRIFFSNRNCYLKWGVY
ncbi:hypothetical protein CICLE_v10003003mg [Citrus x clementina]|uniref:Uncharacterized protein n=2 Tax=Citrus TaxID=2706 RepID=A0A067D9H2_CITSI|nr:hypothetical protein CICLE_v10003003mg [Citrus x clementina]KDO38170.1 hypothetical protein CISIN_1g041796mg [Citrus sinensis]